MFPHASLREDNVCLFGSACSRPHAPFSCIALIRSTIRDSAIKSVHIKRCGLLSQAKLCSSSAMDRTVQLALLCLQACLLISAFTSPDTQTDALLKENPLSSDSMVDEITTERPVEMEKDLDKVARGCYLRPGACGPLTKNPRTKRQAETRPAPRRARKGKRKRPANRPGAIGLSGHKGARPINHIGGGSVVGLAGPVEDHIPNHHSEKPSVVACFGEDHIHHPEQEGAVRLSGVRKRHKQKSRPGSGSNIALTDIDQKATPDDTNTRAYW